MGYAAYRANAVLSTHGDAATLARTGEGTTITLRAKRISGETDPVGGGSSVQQVFRVKIGTTELDASAWVSKSPKRGDTLTIDGRARAVRDARPLKDGTVTALWELEVAG